MWHVACTIMLQLLPTAATGKTKASFIDFIACLTELYMLLYQCKCHYAYTHFCIIWHIMSAVVRNRGGKGDCSSPCWCTAKLQHFITTQCFQTFWDFTLYPPSRLLSVTPYIINSALKSLEKCTAMPFFFKMLFYAHPHWDCNPNGNLDSQRAERHVCDMFLIYPEAVQSSMSCM